MNAIVIAWVRLDGAEPTDELYRYDGVHWKRRWKTVPKGHAAVWVNKVQPGDLERAREYAEREHGGDPFWAIYKYPTETEDLLQQARERVLEEYRLQREREHALHLSEKH